jgi:hypothetical protein
MVEVSVDKSEHYDEQAAGNSGSGVLEQLLHRALTQTLKDHVVLMIIAYFLHPLVDPCQQQLQD